MRPQNLLDQLPKFGELIEHPQVRQAVDRLNRSVAVARVRTAIDDLAAEVGRRAEQWQGASASEMVDRLVRQIGQPRPSPRQAVINATGELWQGRAGGPPLASAAIDAASEHVGEYRRGESDAVLTRLTGAEAVWIAASHSGAVAATLASLAAGETLIIARNEVGEVDPGERLTDLASLMGVELHEVGTAEGATVEDFSKGIEAVGSKDARPILFRRTPETHELIGGLPRVPTEALAKLAHEQGALLIEDLGGSAPCDLRYDTGTGLPSVASVLASGADGVLLRGGGLLGGPACGIVLGRKKMLETIRTGPQAALLAASSLTSSMLAATAELFDHPAQLAFTHPLYALLTTPLENLRTRVERLAPQINAAPGYSAEGVELQAGESSRPCGLVRLASWGLAIRPERGDVSSVAKRLETLETPIWGRIEGDRLLLDFRTVFPRQEAAILESFLPTTN